MRTITKGGVGLIHQELHQGKFKNTKKKTSTRRKTITKKEGFNSSRTAPREKKKGPSRTLEKRGFNYSRTTPRQGITPKKA
jgi:hypothetical protein